MSLVAYGNSDSDGSDGETIHSLDVKSLPLPKGFHPIANIVKEKDGKSVKIAIPSPADFDSDEDEPVKKKKKIVSSERTGLFALLPAPKNTTIQKSLIPHSISRKPVIEKETSIAKDSDDDDDDDDENKGPLRFFISDNVHQQTSSSLLLSKLCNHPSYQYYQPDSKSSSESIIDDEQMAALEQEAIQIQLEEEEEAAHRPPIEPDPDADIEDEAPTFRYREEPLETNEQMLQKIQGRKNRGKEEINFIDVSVEQEMPKGNEIKRLTEEAGYQTDKPKGPAPSSQQRRKHQITYLAFQAKERELELKNQWAQNRLTRKQTQSKYGF